MGFWVPPVLSRSHSRVEAFGLYQASGTGVILLEIFRCDSEGPKECSCLCRYSFPTTASLQIVHLPGLLGAGTQGLFCADVGIGFRDVSVQASARALNPSYELFSSRMKPVRPMPSWW